MPKLKSRTTHTKVYRPNGTRYAHGKTAATVAETVGYAMAAFYMEFGELPRQDETTIEIIGVTGGWAASVFELKEPKEAKRVDIIERDGGDDL